MGQPDWGSGKCELVEAAIVRVTFSFLFPFIKRYFLTPAVARVTGFLKDIFAQANGFRSMLRVVGTLVRHCSDIMETVRHQLATLGYVAPEVVITKTKTGPLML